MRFYLKNAEYSLNYRLLSRTRAEAVFISVALICTKNNDLICLTVVFLYGIIGARGNMSDLFRYANGKHEQKTA